MTRSLCLCLLLGVFAPAFADEPPAMKSILLVARKDMPDPYFRDSVVLVTNPGGTAPMGVIINRPTDVPLSRIFPEVESLRLRNDKVFFGGPVKRDELMVVFRAATQPPDSIEVLDGVYLGAKRALALEILARDDAPGNVRAFAGHAGWAPGQLEAEIASGAWHLVRADATTVFGRNPEKLWQELERRARAKTAWQVLPLPPTFACRPFHAGPSAASDLNRGLLGHLFNGYAEKYVKEELKPVIARFRTSQTQDERCTLDGPKLTEEEAQTLARASGHA